MAYTDPNWKLKRNKLGVYHTMLWSVRGGEQKVKVRITIEDM